MKLLYFSTCEIVLNGVEQKNEEGKYQQTKVKSKKFVNNSVT